MIAKIVRQLAFLAKLLDKRLAVPGRNVPVDLTHVVTDLIGRDLLELHPAPAKRRVVLPGQHVVHHPRSADLNLANLLE